MSPFSKILFFLCLSLLLAATVRADDADCEACHSDSSLTRVKGGLRQSLFVSVARIEKSMHNGLGCTDCHTALAGIKEYPHPERIQGVNCADCHTEAFEVYMSGFYDHLAQRGFTAIPGCTACHGSHDIAEQANTRAVCGICHSEQRRQFERSVHYSPPDTAYRGVSCTSCHSAHIKTQRGQMLPSDWRLFAVERCVKCHKEQTQDYLNSHHYQQVGKDNSRAPICTDCHGIHELYRVDDPRSLVHIDKLDATCDRCHPGHEATIHRKSDADPRLMTCVACHTGHHTEMARVESAIFKETLPATCNRCHGDDRHKKENLAHGRIMVVDADGGTANCTECHIYHWKISDDTHLGAAQERLHCQNCHPSENRDYERSVHGISARKGHPEAPTCVTCHGEKNIERISSRFNGQSVISLCSSCHANRDVTMKFQLNPNVVKGYLSTYHGQVYSLGYQGREFATCASCHDNHLILPSDNPQSTISKQHIIQTCSRCHLDANINFVGMLQHYDPMVQKENIILTIIHKFMLWLLGVTLSVFGIHTILWLIRTVIDRLRHGRRFKDAEAKKVRYRRFGSFERVLHGIVIVSFLILATTGLPLKYSHSAASQWIAANLLTLRTMAILHRVAAGMTFLYFALHLGSLGFRLAARRVTLKKLLWGEDSLVPQPCDFREFFQHIGWFLGIVQKPQFGRWAYWEKFDYFAVFWGVSIIGLSGLTLWFPEFFTKILPGWAINAAHIIHSEEALLATGFIFTIHFFNEHLRPENFPFDEVIFTGSMSSTYLKKERGRWYQQLQESGRLEAMSVAPMKFLPRLLLYIFGFLALGIGLALLALIIIGSFS
ncbi:MAG: hypothetical protein FJY65_11345 [Calditrichaeota bacterium]|nr:hypothetical protein [Calditrichota bacterium]